MKESAAEAASARPLCFRQHGQHVWGTPAHRAGALYDDLGCTLHKHGLLAVAMNMLTIPSTTHMRCTKVC
jgi:hypothetical protein